MDLQIRSQDKETLIKIFDGIYYYYDEETKEHTIHNGYNNLGIYKTKERALEVLDEIQNILILKDMYKYDRELVLKSWENADEETVQKVRQLMSVYEMPKE